MTDPRPLAERVREIAMAFDIQAAQSKWVPFRVELASKSATLHEAADALERLPKP